MQLGTYTLAAKKTDGSILLYTKQLKSSYTIADNGLGLGVGDDSNVVVSLPSGDYEWAALYEGEYTDETLPVYQPKGYGAELLECMRYYREQSDRLCAGFMYNNTTACFVYHINPPMRTTPTIIELAGNLLQHGFVDATLAGITHQKDYLISFDMSPVLSLNSGEGVIFNGRIKLSADL